MNSKKFLTVMGFTLSVLFAASSFGAELPANYEISLQGMNAVNALNFKTQPYSFSGTLFIGGLADMTLNFAANGEIPAFSLSLKQSCDSSRWQGVVLSGGIQIPTQTHYKIEFKLCDLSGLPKNSVLGGLDDYKPSIELPLICDLSVPDFQSCALGKLARVYDREDTLVFLNTTDAPKPIQIKRIEK